MRLPDLRCDVWSRSSSWGSWRPLAATGHPTTGRAASSDANCGPREVAVGQPEFEDDVAPLDIAEVAQPLSKRVEYRRLIAVRGCQDADAGDFGRVRSGVRSSAANPPMMTMRRFIR